MNVYVVMWGDGYGHTKTIEAYTDAAEAHRAAKALGEEAHHVTALEIVSKAPVCVCGHHKDRHDFAKACEVYVRTGGRDREWQLLHARCRCVGYLEAKEPS